MSQIIKNLASGPVPPAVPTSFVTDSGTAVPVANILNILTNDTSANNDNGITDNGSGNTVNILLTNRLQGAGTTTGATTSDLITMPLGAIAAVYRFEFKVAGRDTVSGDGVGYSVLTSIRTDGASATIIQSPFIDTDEDASLTGANIDFIASGNSGILRVTGVALKTINYQAVGYYILVS